MKPKDQEEARRLRNAELANKVKRGESIDPAVSQQALFYPPRPIIKKDHSEVARVFGGARLTCLKCDETAERQRFYCAAHGPSVGRCE